MAGGQSATIPDDESLRRLYPRLLLGAHRRLAYMDVLHETTAEDVVHDALEALLEGKCPQHINVDAFLFNRIRRPSRTALATGRPARRSSPITTHRRAARCRRRSPTSSPTTTPSRAGCARSLST